MAQLNAIVDKLLTEASSAYIPKGYVSESVLPLIQSKQYTGKLAKYGQSHLRIETSITGGRGKYRRVEPITRTQSSYSIDGHGLEGLVTKRDYANVELPYKAEEDEALGITTQLWLEKEKVLADTLANTAIITQSVTLAGTEQYSDYLNSDPLDDFSTARETVVNACGVMPNLAVMDILIWNKLRYHPQMLDALGFKESRPGGLSVEELSVALGVEKVLLGMPRYNSAKEGQSDSLAAVWGKHIFFLVAPETAQPYQVSLGYRIQLEGSQPRKVYKFAIDNPPESTGILVEDEYDMFISNASCGYSIKSTIA